MAEYLQLMVVAGVAKARAFPKLLDDYRRANKALVKAADTSGGRLIAFDRLGGRTGSRPVTGLWQLHRNFRHTILCEGTDAMTNLDDVAGIKLMHHMSDLPDDAVLEKISARALRVLVNAGVSRQPNWIVRKRRHRIAGPLILAHLGAYPCDELLLRQAV